MNKKVELIVLNTLEEAILFAASDFIKIAKEAISQRGRFTVALSGGSTPKKVYEALAVKFSTSIDWSKVYLFFSDERVVPLDHQESNYKMAIESGFQKLSIPKEQIFPIPTEGDLEKGIAFYESLVKKNAIEGRFDLMLLGVGDDGHTASLFPYTKALIVKDKDFTPNFVPEKGVWRQTATFKAILESRNIAVWAFGANKKDILKKVLKEVVDIQKYPIQGTFKEVNPPRFILDKAAFDE